MYVEVELILTQIENKGRFSKKKKFEKKNIVEITLFENIPISVLVIKIKEKNVQKIITNIKTGRILLILL